MVKNEIVLAAIDKWGLDRTFYIGAWMLVGVGVFGLIGYATRGVCDGKN